jgi:hypothetical protein
MSVPFSCTTFLPSIFPFDKCLANLVGFKLEVTAETRVAGLHVQYPLFVACGPGSSVGIATGNGLEGPGSNPGGARFPAPVQTGPGPPSLLYNGYRVFPWGEKRPGRDADPSPLPVPRSKTE